eukprot:COSAG04_NODE_175_length_21521_cov_167.404071_12_plen_67_part_00
MKLLPPTDDGAPPSTAQSVKSARSDLVGTIHVPRKLKGEILVMLSPFLFLLSVSLTIRSITVLLQT